MMSVPEVLIHTCELIYLTIMMAPQGAGWQWVPQHTVGDVWRRGAGLTPQYL